MPILISNANRLHNSKPLFPRDSFLPSLLSVLLVVACGASPTLQSTNRVPRLPEEATVHFTLCKPPHVATTTTKLLQTF